MLLECQGWRQAEPHFRRPALAGHGALGLEEGDLSGLFFTRPAHRLSLLNGWK